MSQNEDFAKIMSDLNMETQFNNIIGFLTAEKGYDFTKNLGS
jgi:hypothetical protein